MGDPAIYLKEILKRAPEALSLLCREASSRSYGCFDRNFWQWKFVDFPGARFQEGVWALAGLYLDESPENPYRGSESLLSWIEAAFLFWCRIQHSDGSFDEAYPFERSFVATGFSLLAATEALLLLGDRLDKTVSARVEAAAAKAGRWLCNNDETHAFISNHRLGAAAALYNAAEITGEKSLLGRCRELLASVYERQSPEGWFLEYSGPDPGYETQGLFYLGSYFSRSRDEEALERMHGSAGFLKYFVHPDGSLGGEYGARNTQFYFPGGLEAVAALIPDANAVASFMRGSIEKRACASLGAMDAYNIFPLMNSFLAAHRASGEPLDAPRLPFEEDFTRVFEHAGIMIVSNPSYYSIVNLKKGGVLKCFGKKEASGKYSSVGPYARLGKGAATPVRYLEGRKYRVEDAGASVSGSFFLKNETVMGPAMFVLFRLFMLTLGRIPAVSRAVKKRLAGRLIFRAKELPIGFKRSIRFLTDRIEITDRVTGARGEVKPAAALTELHMGSSQYFAAGLLGESPGRVSVEKAGDETTLFWVMDF